MIAALSWACQTDRQQNNPSPEAVLAGQKAEKSFYP